MSERDSASHYRTRIGSHWSRIGWHNQFELGWPWKVRFKYQSRCPVLLAKFSLVIIIITIWSLPTLYPFYLSLSTSHSLPPTTYSLSLSSLFRLSHIYIPSTLFISLLPTLVLHLYLTPLTLTPSPLYLPSSFSVFLHTSTIPSHRSPTLPIHYPFPNFNPLSIWSLTLLLFSSLIYPLPSPPVSLLHHSHFFIPLYPLLSLVSL